MIVSWSKSISLPPVSYQVSTLNDFLLLVKLSIMRQKKSMNNLKVRYDIKYLKNFL